MKILRIKILILISIVTATVNLHADPRLMICDVPAQNNLVNDNASSFIGGLYKPHRTDSANNVSLPDDATLNVLVVFTQFPDEDPISSTDFWPVGDAPEFMDRILATSRRNTEPYWDIYSETSEVLSDYFQEISRGKFHLTGTTRHMIYGRNRSWYNNNVIVMNNEIYSRLMLDTTIIWSEFDKWKYITDGRFSYESDGNLDLIVIVRRTYPGPAGFAGLDGTDFLIDPINNIWIRANFDDQGSGIVIQGNQGSPLLPHNFNRFFGVFIHELGHFLFGSFHSNLGIMTARTPVAVSDLFLSPFEKLKLGYLTTQNVVFRQTPEYRIKDISSRTEDGQILKVPVNKYEFFLIENRRKISSYDRKMLGDTTRMDLYMNTGEYGKGIYIYHHQSINMSYSNDQDLECADGLWNWKVKGKSAPDWSQTDSLVLLARDYLSNIIYNDNGAWDYYNKDGLSANYLVSFEPGVGVFFGLGKRGSQHFDCGTDKVFTNYPEYWTSRELYGDRHDAWNIGYNEIFSPFSNPNTKDWMNKNTGIYIHYYALENDVAKLRIYKSSNAGSEFQILKITPPSKPMGVKAEFYQLSALKRVPKIEWIHNAEPDMIRTNEKKRYNIYRATGANMQFLPHAYYKIASVEIDSGIAPEYIDSTVVLRGSIWYKDGELQEYPVRYKIQAVDAYSDTSVLSDFTGVVGLDPEHGSTGIGKGDNTSMNGDPPDKFELSDNFPNPFNSSTTIRFMMPVANHVVLKIYDVTGKEVATVIDEFIEPGSYFARIDSDKYLKNASSGIYFYSIRAGSFYAVKKMALIK